MSLEQKMSDFFKFEENDTNMQAEIRAGITTFLTMAYILVVNPSFLELGFTIDPDTGVGLGIPFNQALFFPPEILIKRVPRAPPWVIRNQNTEKDTLNRLVMTPRPGDPYLYELCPPEIFRNFRKIRNSGGVPPPLEQVHQRY